MMTHQQALLAGAKIAGELESYAVSVYLRPRGLAESARGEVTVHVPPAEGSIDTFVRLRDRVRSVGYDVEFECGGDLEVVGGWTSPRDPTRPSR